MTFLFKRSTWIIFLLTLAACVTVNIYFPAAAAEKAADAIIQDIWHEENTAPKSDAPPLSQLNRSSRENMVRFTAYSFSPRTALVAILSAISGTAYAQTPDFNISSPEISALTAKMAARFNKLRPLYDSGAIGLTADGYVALRDASLIPMVQRAQAQQLVNAENADRKALYRAVYIANKQPPGWEEKIRNTFAKRWIKQAQKGWWFKDKIGGSWKQK